MSLDDNSIVVFQILVQKEDEQSLSIILFQNMSIIWIKGSICQNH